MRRAGIAFPDSRSHAVLRRNGYAWVGETERSRVQTDENSCSCTSQVARDGHVRVHSFAPSLFSLTRSLASLAGKRHWLRVPSGGGDITLSLALCLSCETNAHVGTCLSFQLQKQQR